ncbi:MAG: protein kinase, partial [Myxococcales bacterium]|nr:protein kinase [Myxococcales bacterium]
RYRVIGPLGEGGMAKVLLAFTTSAAGVSKLVVIKLLRPELAGDESFIDMFVDEARLAALLSHANVIHTYEVGSDEQGHFLVMEYLEGQALSSLYKKLPRDRMPRDLQLHVLGELLTGLDYAHDLTDRNGQALHIVHRDVSPQNVMVTYDAQVKVLDFGIAKAISNNTATLTGTLKGKVAYISPEQALGQPVDRSADVFAVGVMLWEALAGRRINLGTTDVTLLTKRLAREEPRIRDVAPDVDPRLAEICDRAMAFEAADRYPTCGAFRDALDPFLPPSERRERTRELSTLVRQLFSDEREKQRALVDAALHGANLSVSAVYPAHRERTPNREQTPSLQTAQSVNPAPSSPAPPAARSGGRAWLIGAVLAAVAIVVGVRMMRREQPRDAASSPSPAVSAAAPAKSMVAPADPVVIDAPAPVVATPPSSPAAGTLVAAQPATNAKPAVAPKPTAVAVASTAAATTVAAAPTPSAVPTATAPPKKGKHTIDDKDPYAP